MTLGFFSVEHMEILELGGKIPWNPPRKPLVGLNNFSMPKHMFPNLWNFIQIIGGGFSPRDQFGMCLNGYKAPVANGHK